MTKTMREPTVEADAVAILDRAGHRGMTRNRILGMSERERRGLLLRFRGRDLATITSWLEGADGPGGRRMLTRSEVAS